MSKMKSMMAATLAVMLLGGCGESPYTLTEEEQNTIVNYSAHIVAKYNSNQKEGLSYVNMSDTEMTCETPTEEEPVAGTESMAQNEASTQTDVEATEVPEEQEQIPATLNDIFGTEGLNITYTGAELAKNYMEGTYYSLDADPGNTFLVVGIDIANAGSADAVVDHLTLSPVFNAAVNDEKAVKQEQTILLEDFSTYEGTVSPGKTQSTVLLFQVPDTVTEVQNLSLSVTVNSTSYQITL